MGCLACTPECAQRTVHEGITTYTQYLNPERITAIAYHGAEAADDPLWPTSGAASQAEYGRWCRHA